jgi:hypothetical protein
MHGARIPLIRRLYGQSLWASSAVFNVNAGNVEDPPMAVVLMIRFHRQRTTSVYIVSVSVMPHVVSLGHTVLPGRTAKLPISVLSPLLFDGLEGIPKLEWSAWPVWKTTRSRLMPKSNTPQGQHMHLCHTTCITFYQ